VVRIPHEYDFDIKHIKGKENKVVDALNKRVHEMHAKTISMYQSYLKDRILEVAKSDQKYMEVREKIQQGNLQQEIEDYKLENDEILIYMGIIYVPNSHELKNMILREMHGVPYAGNPGYQKTIVAIKSQYYWLGMKKEVAILFPNVWNVKRSRLRIDTQLVCYNHYPFLSGNGKL
jgi:hypothetical protein